MSDNVKVSVVVAVYNRETTLDRCIDSLIYQTLDDIEIILVDDSSTDRSMEVMKRWESLFPDKIRVFSNPTKGVAHTKNMGIAMAQGQYVSFVDSDDYVEYQAFQRLYECAKAHSFPDIVTSPIWKVTGNQKRRMSDLTGTPVRQNYLAMDTFFLPGKLFDRKLFDTFGMLPHLGIGEDVSWLFPVISRTETFAHINVPTYFYEYSPNSISLNYGTIELIGDIFKGSERIIRETASPYREQALKYAWKRIDNLIARHVYFRDVFSEYISQHMEEITSIPGMAKLLPNISKTITVLEGNHSLIPQTIFCDTEEDIALNEGYSPAFRGAVKAVALKDLPLPADCPALVRQAAEAGHDSFVLKYMAVRKCYEEGGIYLSNELEISGPFAALIHDPAIFVHESDDRFSERIFGCAQGSEVFAQILKTYEMPELYDDPFTPLHDRIRTIVLGVSNRHLCNERVVHKKLCVYPVESFIRCLPFAPQPHFTHLRNDQADESGMLTIPADTLKALHDRLVRTEIGTVRGAPGVTSIASLKAAYASLQRQHHVLRKERDAVYNTTSWRITKPLRAVRTMLNKLKSK